MPFSRNFNIAAIFIFLIFAVIVYFLNGRSDRFDEIKQLIEYQNKEEELTELKSQLSKVHYDLTNKIKGLNVEIEESYKKINNLIDENDKLRKNRDSLYNAVIDYSDDELIRVFTELYSGK